MCNIIVSSEIVVGIDAYNRVEIPIGKREGVRFRVRREDMSRHAGLLDQNIVFRRLDPKIGSPDCHPNSLARKMELVARPQPRSRTRIPGLRSIAAPSDSMRHTAMLHKRDIVTAPTHRAQFRIAFPASLAPGLMPGHYPRLPSPP